MAVSCQPALRVGLDSGRYSPSVHLHTPDRYQPESVRSAPTPSSEVRHFWLPQMGHFWLPLTLLTLSGAD